jgi:hypothetical protein
MRFLSSFFFLRKNNGFIARVIIILMVHETRKQGQYLVLFASLTILYTVHSQKGRIHRQCEGPTPALSLSSQNRSKVLYCRYS